MSLRSRNLLSGKLSVVMPAYNESEYIERNVIETVEILNRLGYIFEVIVVDDGSNDNTYMEALKSRARHPETIRVVRYDCNQGKGNALMCGTAHATGDYVVFLDADMDLHPGQLPVLFEILNATGADIVIGSKRHPLSNVNYPGLRRLYSAVYYAMVHIMFALPVRDTQTGLKIFKTEVLHRVFPKLLVKRFAFDLEMLTNAHRLGYTIAEAPVTLHFRRDFGRIHFGDVYRIFLDTLAIFYRMHLLKYYDRVEPVPLSSLSGASQAREIDLADVT